MPLLVIGELSVMGRCACLLLAALSAFAQERFHVYNTEDGLPHNSVLAIRRARDGYLWFTTYRGLVRFDGVHFKVFDPSNTPAIAGTTFAAFSLIEDRQGALWAGSWNSGAIRYQNGIFTSITTRDGLPNHEVVRIDEDEQGTIWIFTYPGLSKFRNGRVEVVRSIEGEPVEPFLKAPLNLGLDPYLWGLWRCRGSQLQRFAWGKWSDVPLPKGVNAATVQFDSLTEDSHRDLWFTVSGRPGSIFRVRQERLTVFDGVPQGTFANYQDKAGRLWITDRRGRSAVWRAGRTSLLDGVSTTERFFVTEDEEGSFWTGTLNGGLGHGTRAAIETVRLPGGPEVNTIWPILQDRAGDIWVGSYGLSRIRGRHSGNWLHSPVPDRRHDAGLVSALWEEQDGTILLGTRYGVKRFRNGRIEQPDRPLLGIRLQVNAILRARSGGLWVGCDDGLYLYHDAKLTFFDDPKTNPRGDVRALYEDKAGTLWIGTDSMLCKYRDGKFTCFGGQDERSNWKIRGLMQDAGNVIWAGTAGNGVLRIEGDRFSWIKAADGLPSNDAAAILDDGHGFFWMSSHLGIYRVRKEELNEFAAHRIDRVNSISLGKRDGLNDVNCAGNGQPHGFVAKDGRLWFPTRDGLAIVEPRRLEAESSPPPVRIESCSAGQHEIPCRGTILLPAGSQDLSITYTGLNLLRSGQITFRYMLNGLNENWVNAGSRRTAYYSYLPPDTYTFRVTSAGGSGVWNSSPAELTITVEPYFYQALWFRVSLAAAVLTGIVLAWRRRTIQFNRRQALERAYTQQIIASQEAERKRIAAELHDGLGQRIALIRSMAMLASRSPGRDRGEQVDAIAAEAGHAMTEVRQISHDLRPYQLDLLGLVKAVETLASRTCDAAGIALEFQADDLAGGLPKEREIHVYRIVQECLNNIVRHSGSTRVRVGIHRNGAGISLTVNDNGVGFSPEGYRQRAGFGITGIKERAELLHGKAEVQSIPGEGTTVTIDIASE